VLTGRTASGLSLSRSRRAVGGDAAKTGDGLAMGEPRKTTIKPKTAR